MRPIHLALGLGLTALALAGCGGGTDAADKTTIINQTVMPSAASATAGAAPAPATAQPQAAGDLPQPPTGASVVKTDTEDGLPRTKYSINDQLPSQVVDYYTNLWRNDGYTIVSSGSGPDSGRQGGATAVASKNGQFIGVNADADPGEPTHFDVCQGASEMAVRNCID